MLDDNLKSRLQAHLEKIRTPVELVATLEPQVLRAIPNGRVPPASTFP